MSRWQIELTSPGELDVAKFEMEAGKLIVHPNFYGRGSAANSARVAVLRVLDDNGKVRSTSLITISGMGGKPSIVTLSGATAPSPERKKEKPA